VTGEVLGHELRPCRCRARTCARCGPGRAAETRGVLLEKVRGGAFRHPRMLTLTCDPRRRGRGGELDRWGGFADAEAAYAYVMEGEFVRRLLERLGVTVWVVVEEFHRGRAATGFEHEGWVHWHILFDLPAGGWVDYEKAWRLGCDKWGLGGLKVSDKVGEGKGPEHAVNYIMKYLGKAGDAPAWFLQRGKSRLVWGSRLLGRLVMGVSRARADGEGTGEVRRRRAARALLERMAECCEGCNVFEHWRDGGTGVVGVRWVCQVRVTTDDVVEAVQEGDGGDRLRALGVKVVPAQPDRKGRTRLLVFMVGCWAIRDRLRGLVCEMECSRFAGRRAERVACRRAELLAA
jgi:hypothetical protein